MYMIVKTMTLHKVTRHEATCEHLLNDVIGMNNSIMNITYMCRPGYTAHYRCLLLAEQKNKYQ